MSDTRPTFDQLADSARLALSRGDSESARTTLSDALRTADAEGTIRDESPESLLRLGAVYHDAGLHAEAERLFGDAVAIAEATGGGDHPSLAAALSALGIALVARGANDEAEPLLTRALAITEQRLGADHPDLNSLLNVLSRVYLKQGAFARAEPLLERVLAMKRAKGEEHPEVATVLASLALVRQGVGDHEGAEQLGRRVLQIREKTLAPNHFAIASALELLADECAARGKVEEAGRLYQRALSIREQTLGVAHASLRVLRERIVDLQLQSAELAGGEESFTPVASPPPVPHVERTPPLPPVRRAIALSDEAERALPPSLSIATRGGSDRAQPPRAPMALLAELEGRDEQRQQALVLPAATGALSLQEELQIIEEELNAEANDAARDSRLRTVLTALSATLATRRAQVGIAVTTILALLLAALVAQPRAAEQARSGAGSPRADGTAAAALRASGSTQRVTSDANGSAYTHTAAGSLAPRPLNAEPSAASTGREPESRSSRSGQRNSSEEGPSLEISRTVRLAAPVIPVQRADSIAHASEMTKPGEQPFSKQFWTSALDKRPSGEPSSAPTSARLIGTMPEPAYPVFLRKNGVEGEVVVQFVVDETGKPDMSSLEVLQSPHDAMSASVRKVIAQLRFEPARTGGASPAPRTETVRSSFLFKAGGR